MPFRRNIGRERTLLRHWRRGDTVKVASVLTGIPEGSISHYYARFNRNPEKYQKIVDSSYQEPPRSRPQDVAMMALGLSNTLTNATLLIQRGEGSRLSAGDTPSPRFSEASSAYIKQC